MSTFTTRPSESLAELFPPSSLFRLTLDQYEQMVDRGILGPLDKVHLINGILVAKMTENDRHATADLLCGEALERIKPPGYHVRPGKPIRIPSQSSKPEPDRSLVRGTSRDYLNRSPAPQDIALVVEVADSSLIEDFHRASLYGRAGIPSYWIINVKNAKVEAYSDAGPDGYQTYEVLTPGQQLTLTIDGTPVGTINVANLLP